MKKLLLFIAFALAAIFAQAQDYTRDSLFLEVRCPTDTPYFSLKQPSSTSTSDGKILTRITSKTLLGGHLVDFGDWLYRIDPQNLVVVDSVFVETNYGFEEYNGSVLLADAPDDEGCIFAKLIHNKLTYQGFPGKTWLRISRIDDQLNMQAYEDATMVTLEDSIIINRLIDITLEGEQIVLAYPLADRTPVIARVGLDGMLHDKTICDFHATHGFAVYNDTPREYALYDWSVFGSDTCLVYHVFDSLLTPMETIVTEGHFGDIYLICPGNNHIIPLDDGSFIQASQYEQRNITRNGVCLLKYDKTTHERLANAMFESWPIYSNRNSYAYPIGLKHSADGNLYFAYRTNNNGSANKGWIGIVKLDTDLNIIWQRYCLGSWNSSTGYNHSYCQILQTEDGFMIGGRIHKSGESYNVFYYFVHDNDANNIPEAEAFLRPYMYYPNPNQDRLHLQYSPDVQPTRIELYDLQGRLVRSQSQGLESVDMQGLASGQYLMKVTMEDGKSFTDKVVKE